MDPEIEDELETNADAPPSLRDTLSQALRQSNEEPGGDVEQPELEQPAEPAEGETQEQADQRARDAEGRFAKEKKKPAEKPAIATKPVVKPAAVVRPGAKPVAPVAKPVPGAVPTSAPGAAAPAAVEMKAPQSFRGPAKEAWAQTPEPVRIEVLRREKEIATQLQGFGEDRKYASAMKQAFAPFEAHIAAEGSHPAQTIQRLMGTALALRTAPPAHKAALVADMITTFGVPLEGLVAALQGKAPPAGQPQHQPQHVDPAAIAQQVRTDLMKELGTQRETQLLAKSEAEVAAYLENQPMHGLDGSDYSGQIRETMADLIESAGKRKSTISLEQAYSLAARAHPEVSKVLEQRERAATAKKANASTSRARVAASSVRHESATQPVGKAEVTSLRGALEAARDKHSER